LFLPFRFPSFFLSFFLFFTLSNCTHHSS
jgi:hypothetical protein